MPCPVPSPRVIGHRGAAAIAPENTLAGFRAAGAAGARWVEFDVQASRDGQAFLLHDARLERTTDGRGIATDRRMAELEELDAGTWFAPAYRGERVPRLEAALALAEELELGVVVEIKAEAGDGPRTARAALAPLKESDAARVILSSFDEAALATVAAEAPLVPRALLVKTVPADWRARLERLRCAALHVGERGLDQAAVAAVARSVPVRVYTVNAPARARELLAWGAAAVFTDCPDVIVSAVGQDTERPARTEPAGEKRT